MTADYEADYAQAEYDKVTDEARAMRNHILNLHWRLLELASLLEMRAQTSVSERVIRESRDLVTEGKKYE